MQVLPQVKLALPTQRPEKLFQRDHWLLLLQRLALPLLSWRSRWQSRRQERCFHKRWLACLCKVSCTNGARIWPCMQSQDKVVAALGLLWRNATPRGQDDVRLKRFPSKVFLRRLLRVVEKVLAEPFWYPHYLLVVSEEPVAFEAVSNGPVAQQWQRHNACQGELLGRDTLLSQFPWAPV